MKKSILYFSIATLFGISIWYFPSLSGEVILNQKEEPVGLFSKLWAAGRPIKLTQSYPEGIRVLKIDAHGNSLNLLLNKGDNSYYSRDLKKFTASISKDTLIIQMKGLASFFVTDNGNLEKIIIDQANAGISMGAAKELLTLELNNCKDINLTQSNKVNFALSHLQLNLRGKSKLNLGEGRLKSITAQLSDAELNYSNKLSVDTAYVNLQGRSTVKSTDAGSVQELKTLLLNGNKQFFKANLIGKNVALVLKD